MATCLACRRAKVKCDKKAPCGRCVRLGIDCLPAPPSRKGKVKRFTRPNHEIADVIAATLQSNVQGVRSESHAGLVWLLHSWLAISVRRRSVALLAKAATLATKLGIPMDVFLGMNAAAAGGSAGGSAAPPPPASAHATSPSAAVPFLQRPSDSRTVRGPALQWSEVPAQLRGGVGGEAVADSWTLCIEWSQGVRRDFCSAAFQRDVKTHDEIARIYRENSTDVLKALVGPSSCKQIGTRFGHMVARYRAHGQPPTTARVASVALRKKAGGTIDACVRLSFCILPTPADRAFFLLQFARTKGGAGADGAEGAALLLDGGGAAELDAMLFFDDVLTTTPADSVWANPDDLDDAIVQSLLSG